MSRLAKKPIIIPENVDFRKEDALVSVKGPKGELSVEILPFVDVVKTDDGIQVSLEGSGSNKQAQANLGTTVSLIRNAITGVNEGYQKELTMKGVGYGAKMEGDTLVLDVGYSHPIRFDPPGGVEVTAQKTDVSVRGADKALVGQVAAKIRSFRKPEPYQGSGIRYKDEVIRRKVGKKAAAAGGIGA